MQNVNFREKLRFRLPKNWTAEYIKNGALFRDPTGTGVLMLDVVDFECPEPATTETAVDLLATYGNHEGREILHLKNGSAFVTFVERSPESEPVTSFVWEVVHPISASILRMAAFSFIVKSDTEDSHQVVDTVTMLTREIADTVFLLDFVGENEK